MLVKHPIFNFALGMGYDIITHGLRRSDLALRTFMQWQPEKMTSPDYTWKHYSGDIFALRAITNRRPP